MGSPGSCSGSRRSSGTDSFFSVQSFVYLSSIPSCLMVADGHGSSSHHGHILGRKRWKRGRTEGTSQLSLLHFKRVLIESFPQWLLITFVLHSLLFKLNLAEYSISNNLGIWLVRRIDLGLQLALSHCYVCGASGVEEGGRQANVLN